MVGRRGLNQTYTRTIAPSEKVRTRPPFSSGGVAIAQQIVIRAARDARLPCAWRVNRPTLVEGQREIWAGWMMVMGEGGFRDRDRVEQGGY